MAEKEIVETSEAQIAVHWGEEDYYYPSYQFVAQANMTDPAVYDRFSLDNFPNCFKEYADLLDWYEYWHTILDTSDAPCWKWFVGGKINASYNCVDRHLAKNKNKTAIHFAPEPMDEKYEHITYQELYVRVNEFAALLRDFAGLKAGDRVTLHMPMLTELPITMLACARLGVIHSQVFGGFSGRACADRIIDSNSRVLITADAYYRSGTLLDHKQNADIACDLAEKNGQKVDKVLVWQRYPGKASSPAPMKEGRDYFVNDLLKDYYGARVDPVPMPAEAPLFLMYTSGTTGKPKGCQHGTGGYLAYVAGTSKYVQDIHPEDVFNYIIAVLQCPSYRGRYREFLSRDFPRIPLPGSLDLFRALSRLGIDLVALHLMESPKLNTPITKWRGTTPSAELEKVIYSDETVWIDKAQTEGFRGVPESVWNFHIGGYQVCHKWLDDRRKAKRRLSADDITHYQKIVVALNETIRLMAEIDKVIEKHGGWPGAFTSVGS